MEKAMNSAEARHEPQPQRRLTRSPHGMVAGVCAGLSDCLGINLIFTRFVFVVLGLANGIGVLIYLILMVIIPAAAPPEHANPALTCPPRSHKKTLFAYIGGAMSICAALLTFLNDATSVLENTKRLSHFIQSNRPQPVADVPDQSAMESKSSVDSTYVPGEVGGIEGSATVIWSAAGVTYQGYVEMAGARGALSVVFRDPESLSEIEVHQNLSVQYGGYGMFLVGSEPSRVDYSPDMFRLVRDSNGYLAIIEACDALWGCHPVNDAYGDLQLVSG
jgi:phage shock protein PspC (stress-responsive transcriptional regulator)